MSSQLGQLAPLVEDTNLVAVWLSHLPLRDRLTVSRVCSGLCKKVNEAQLLVTACSGSCTRCTGSAAVYGR
jgi:hypothetical protein